MTRWFPHLRVRVLAGLVFLLPLAVCFWLVDALFGIVDRLVANELRPWLGLEGLPSYGAQWASRLIALVVLVVLLYLIGMLGANMLGRRLLDWAVLGLERIPMIGAVYRTTRQLFTAIGPGSGSAFRRCVLIQYPRPGCWAIAFVSNEQRQSLGEGSEPSLAVYVPTALNPTAGFFLLVPEREARPLSISVEEGLKIIVSGGIVLPSERWLTPEARS